ncbi:MAG: hypothetical protein M1376_09150 [Planctomycetes bacterium]|nr:hypothetical protein [Planctomycetota bacterium]
MLTKTIVALSVFGLLLPAAAFAQGFSQGDKEVLLNGAGVSDKDFDNTIFSVEGSLGYFFTRNIEAAVRQALAFTEVENAGSSWNASTRGALDYHLDLGRFWPFVGGNIGYIYGDDVSDKWEAGIEGGLKFFVNTTTFILGMLEYDWFLNNNHDDGFSDGQRVYVAGLGFRW